MSISNKYLVQALRAYCEKHTGQFNQETTRPVQLTQDAAAEIERLNALVDKLQERAFAIGIERPCLSGNYQRWSWTHLAQILSEKDGAVVFYTLVATETGLEGYGSIPPKKGTSA